MIVSTHRHGLIYSLFDFLQVRLGQQLVVSCRILISSLVFSLMLISQAMATDATNREHAIEIAKAQNGGGGKVLGVATQTDSAGNTLFSVKLLSNGRVRVFTVKRAP